MPARSVLLNVFTTAKGLSTQPPEGLVREVHGRGENFSWGSEGTKGGNGEGREAGTLVKHDSTQHSPEDSIAIATTYNGFTASTTDNISPVTLSGASTDLAASIETAASNDHNPNATLASKAFKPIRTCDNCGYTPATSDVTLKQCSRCKVTLYCSAKCQRSNWPSHKKACSQPSTPTVNATEIPAGNDTHDSRAERHITPEMSVTSTPASPSEDGTTSTAATSPGFYFEYKTEMLNSPSAAHASIPLA